MRRRPMIVGDQKSSFKTYLRLIFAITVAIPAGSFFAYRQIRHKVNEYINKQVTKSIDKRYKTIKNEFIKELEYKYDMIKWVDSDFYDQEQTITWEHVKKT